MKHKPITRRPSNGSPSSLRTGFTLVELLVVITIIIALASVVFFVTQKVRSNALAAVSLQNMRQIGPFLVAHATDNGGRLPSPRADVPNLNGGFTQLHWHEVVMQQAYPDTSTKLLRDNQWWISNKPFLRNPLCNEKSKEWPFAWWNPGYAMNLRIARNLGMVRSEDWGAGREGPQTSGVPMAAISQPETTPIIAPRGNWHYDFTPDQIKDPNLVPFMLNGKMPILFVDGHVETMKLQEYVDRRLHLMPPPRAATGTGGGLR
jgi:prepilin-type N-terminal cleavage/methylation domain-containing protein/prepilin-type processing-associated H-X9-DG protein